jgi:DnaJ domain
MAQTYYEILGVAETATPEEIEAAFKKRAREVHPDTVAPDNAYLRQVAAEAFKDLSEAKAILLNRTEREKYDAKLSYERGTSGRGASSAPPPSQQASWSQQGSRGPAPTGSRRQESSRSQRSSARGQSPRPRRAPVQVTFKPLTASLESFAFLLLGVIAIFFVGWLIALGRTPPLWAAVLTLALGVVSFRHGLRPITTTRVRGGIMPFLIGGFVVVAIFFSIWLPSTEIVLTRPAPELERKGEDVAAPRNNKTAGRFGAPRTNGSNPARVTVDESGDGDPPGLVTKIWKDVRDGKNYRTRALGDVLFLEAVNSNNGDGQNAGGIVHCDFRREASAAQDWTGVCSERNPADQSIRYASASVSTLSDTRMEGSTIDIPEFLMVPVETVTMGSAAGGRSGEMKEPDVSGLSDADKQSLETACASEKLMQGPAEYNECLRRQLEALRNAPKAPDLSGLSIRERDSIELVCSNSKLMEGPAAYNRCLMRQLDLMKKQPH